MNKCDNCELRKAVAKAFDLHWLGEDDCPFEYKNYCMAKPSLRVESADRHPRCPLVPVPPHGRLIDADEFLKRAIGTKCFRGDYALMLEELVGESTTVILAEEGET